MPVETLPLCVVSFLASAAAMPPSSHNQSSATRLAPSNSTVISDDDSSMLTLTSLAALHLSVTTVTASSALPNTSPWPRTGELKIEKSVIGVDWSDRRTMSSPWAGLVPRPVHGLEAHPGFLQWNQQGSPGSYFRNAALYDGWDGVATIGAIARETHAREMSVGMPNDWDRTLHGPVGAPGDCKDGIFNPMVPGFAGVFDRDLLYRAGIDIAPDVLVHSHIMPLSR